MKILIQNGHVVDPLTGVDEVCDVLVRDTDIEKVEKNLQAKADRVIDASGCYVMPGFIDLHVHLRKSRSHAPYHVHSSGKFAKEADER